MKPFDQVIQTYQAHQGHTGHNRDVTHGVIILPVWPEYCLFAWCAGLVWYACCATQAFGQFEMTGMSARAMGMANAYAALVDDASAVSYNPGGLGWVRRPEIVTTYGRLHLGLEDGSQLGQSYLAAAYPIDTDNAVGFGWSWMSLVGAYQEQVWTVSYARGMLPGLKMVGSVKWLTKGYGEDEYTAVDPLFQRYGLTASGWTGDLGLMARWGKHYAAGFVVSDLTQPNLGLGDVDRVPMTVKASVGYCRSDMGAAVEWVTRLADWTLRLGTERWFEARQFAVRGGFEWGSREFRSLSVGATYRTPSWQVDYAFVYALSGLKGLAGSHRVSLGVRLGDVPLEEWEEREGAPMKTIEEEMNRLRRLLEEAQGHNERLEADFKLVREEARQETERQLQQVRGDIAVLREQLKGLERQMHQSGSPAPLKPVRPKTYVVEAGETLKTIAEKFYGSAEDWKKIYDANAERIERGVLTPGQELILP